MNKHILLFTFGCCLGFAAAAQQETYDVVSFTPPAGWNREVNESKISFTTTHGTYWCRVAVYKSIDSRGTVQQDFANEWTELVVKPFGIKDPPMDIQLPEPKEWARQSGGAVWQYQKAPATVMLSTLTGFGRSVSFLAMTNSKNYGKIITAFLSDFTLKKPALPQQTSAGANAGPSIIGAWQKKEDHGDAGYRKQQYIFKSDGTYEFLAKNFAPSDTSIRLTRETGAWQARGNILVIDPSKSNIESWSKKNGTDAYGEHMNARPQLLERVRYRFSKTFLATANEWQLVLANEKPTYRDGPFSAGTDFPRSWLYHPVTDHSALIDYPK